MKSASAVTLVQPPFDSIPPLPKDWPSESRLSITLDAALPSYKVHEKQSSTLVTTLTITGLDSGARVTVPVEISKNITATSFTATRTRGLQRG